LTRIKGGRRSRCCESRDDDGVVDEVAIRRALDGERVRLSRTEQAVAMHAARTRPWLIGEDKEPGLDRLAQHFGTGKTYAATMNQRSRTRSGWHF